MYTMNCYNLACNLDASRVQFLHSRVRELSEGWNRIIDEHKKHPLKPKLPKIKDTGASVIVSLFSGRTIPDIEIEGLNERQEKGVQLLKRKGRVTTKDYVEITKTSLITAKRDLSDLIKKGVIKRVGSLKTGDYIFGSVNDTINDTIKETINDAISKGLIGGQTEEITNRLVIVVSFIAQNGFITRPMIERVCEVSKATAKRDVLTLKRAQLISFTGARKTGRYVLTERGKQITDNATVEKKSKIEKGIE